MEMIRVVNTDALVGKGGGEGSPSEVESFSVFFALICGRKDTKIT